MNRQILRLALPNILTNLTVPMLGMVDMYLMGHLDSVHFMGAVALGGVIFNFVYWGFAFLRMSISGLAAQTVGREDKQEMALVLQRGLLIAVSGSLLLLLLQIPLAEFSFWLLEGSPEVKAIARDYFFVRIWAAPAAITLMVFYGWYLGMQNAIYPMLIAVTVNLVNVVTSFLFVHHFNMQAEGVALGSVVGQYSGLILALVIFFRKYKWIIPEFTSTVAPLLKNMRQFINVSSDIFIRTLCIIAVFTFFTSRSAGIGDVTLAINSALLQYLFLFAYFLDGFAYAGEALVGKYYGARNKTMLGGTIRKLMLLGAGLAILFTLIYALMGESLLRLFTKQSDVLDQGKDYLLWVTLIPLVSFASFIWDGIYIGITASRAMRNSMIISAILFFFIPFYLLFPHVQNHAIWISMVLFMLARGVLLTILYPKAIRSFNEFKP
ncbi:MATE family efflux transporter [Alkaliflexus imshenetskii]|uniref:MATE family efflux transporter n=1 Tax=Alkaliflexus imshenetskii TaxID=286730 RepID=UPI00047C1537|nr:MATE family efflux transporter [Alkaliflexus imshenetskii]